MENRMFTLNSHWLIAKDEKDIGRSAGWENHIPDTAQDAFVPSIIQQFFPEYHGLAYYWCRFTPEITKGNTDRLLLRFGGVDYKADVWLNGKYLGCEECCETPFTFDVTNLVNIGRENLLVVRVLNPCDTTIDGINLLNVPHRNKTIKKQAGSNLNHGGIWYEVDLLSLPAVYMEDVFLIPDSKTGNVTVSAELAAHEIGTDAMLTVRLCDRSHPHAPVVQESFSLPVSQAKQRHEVHVTVPDYKLWDVDNPNLYCVELTLKTKFGEHRITKKIGFRDFHVENGYFYLNGKKIFLKSAHTGNAFPIGQMFPVHPGHLRQDLIYAKSCGFNMIRAISGMLRPEQLDIADEIGLMIYEECLASWCLGNSNCRDWNDEESYKEARDLIPEMPLGDETIMLGRWRDTTEKMILRDRNHPSIVVWGLLNETKNNGVFREAVDFLGRARELDPTRLVVLNGGRFDYDLSIGSASNPYSTVWENMWGYDGHPEIVEQAKKEKKNLNHYMGDNHSYATAPFSAFERNLFRSFGKNSLPVFHSEFGIGPLFNVIDELRHFKQYGQRPDLEDCSWLEYQSDALTRDFKRLKLDRVFPFPERMLKESQRLSALDRRIIFDVVRSNPRISGYSLTGLLDHGMCGEGLWTYWRHWKPEVFDAVSDGWEPLRFCLFVAANSYRGDPLELEAVLANENVLKSGEYTANFAIVGEQGTVYTFSEQFAVDQNEFAVPIMKKVLDIDLPRGRYKLVAELPEAAARGNEMEFTIRDRRDNYIGETQIHTIGLGEKARAVLSEAGVTLTDWMSEDCDILLVGLADADTVRRAIETAGRGASVFFLTKDTFLDTVEGTIDAAREVVGDLSRKYYHDWLYHKECVKADPDIFDGLGCGLAALRDFEGVFPGHVFLTEITPDFPICPAFQTGYFAVPMAYMLAYAMFGQRYKEGRVFFSSLEILGGIEKPVAQRLLTNIVKYLKKF